MASSIEHLNENSDLNSESSTSREFEMSFSDSVIQIELL